MSRSPFDDVITFCGRDIDAGRLKIHIGPHPKTISWPVVEGLQPAAVKSAITVKSNNTCIEADGPKPGHNKEIVLEMQKLPKTDNNQEGLRGWIIALGYILFGVLMALTNLLTLQYPLVCSLACPLPMLCLYAQGFIAGLDGRPHLGVALACSALPLPFMCSQWSLPFGAALILALACLQAVASRHIAGVACLVLSLASLCLALLPIQEIEPKWGITLSVFFLLAECVLSSLIGRRVVFRIKYIV